MKISAIICEYNPFHNGHLVHIENTRILTNCDYVVCIMSGNFVQRGEPAILDKYTRARLAIENGADMVIELPTVFAINNAEVFAKGGINLIKAINADYISFGAECKDITKLLELANFMLNEPNEFKTLIKQNLNAGLSLNNARQNAFKEFAPQFEQLLKPNNILAIEYLKALKTQKCTALPVIVQRLGNEHNDDKLAENFSSASAIRECLLNDKLPKKVHKNVPENTLKALKKCTFPNAKILSNLVISRILNMKKSQLKSIYDVNEGLENAFINVAKTALTTENLVSELCSKRYSEARIKRICLNCALNITDELIKSALTAPPYLRVLAMKKSAQNLLSHMASFNANVITRKADYNKNSENSIIEIDKNATILYSIIVENNSKAIDELNGMYVEK